MRLDSANRRRCATVLFLALQLVAGFPHPAASQPASGGGSAAWGKWSELLARQPFPYRVPLPEPCPAEFDDPCAIRLRAANLTGQAWLPCRPPSVEAAVTGHWLKPEGCE